MASSRPDVPPAPIGMTETYLTTAFKDREQVKALGAKWDPSRKQWYVSAGRELAPFAAWLPAGIQAPPTVAASTAGTCQ